MAAEPSDFETLVLSKKGHGVAELLLNRPLKSNSISGRMWQEIPQAVRLADSMGDVRVIILKGAGRHFCAGIDVSSLAHLAGADKELGEGREQEKLRRDIKEMQASFTALEECRKPVIAAIHGACIGAGVDMITACDIRYCTEDARFSVKEVNLAITADTGTLQRLPGIVGEGIARELALTAREFDGQEARDLKLVSRTFPTKEQLYAGVDEIAKSLAAKSPLAVMGTKAILLHKRDHTVSDSLDYVATWNSATLKSTDLKEAMQARLEKRSPSYSKL